MENKRNSNTDKVGRDSTVYSLFLVGGQDPGEKREG